VAMVLCAAIACVHLETFFDATFVTSFWSAAWLLWFVTLGRGEPLHASVLARAVVAVIFLWGVMGKATQGYWNGEVFYHVYFLQRDQWPFGWLRAHHDNEALRAFAVVFSRGVIVGEAVMVLIPLVPSRISVPVGLALLAGMMLVSS